MNVLLEGSVSVDFETFARSHGMHQHCHVCGGCILDPRPIVVESSPVWCVRCKQYVEAATPPTVPLPWAYEIRAEASR